MIEPIHPPQRITIAAAVSSLTATVVPWSNGLVEGWSAWRLVFYAVLALIFVAITGVPDELWPTILRLYRRPNITLLLMAMLGVSLQFLSLDFQLQPIVFMIPPIFALQFFSFRRALLWMGVFWFLMAISFVSLLLIDKFVLAALAGQTALFCFVFFFGYAMVQQGRAFQRADALAATLARERDYLQKLIAISVALPRGMNPGRVLEQVARAGVALTGATEARVWLAEDATWRLSARAGASSLAVTPPIASLPAGVVRLPLEAHDTIIGVLELIEVDPSVVSAVQLEPFTAAAAVAITNARLYEQAHVSATLAERNRLARDLHDTIAQGLTALRLQLEAANRAWTNHPDRAFTRLQRAQELAQSTLDDVRRSVWDLGSALVDGHALTDALAQQMAAFGTRTNLVATYSHSGSTPQLDHGTSTQIIRIVGEALANVEKHADASSVSLASECTADTLTITLVDDGVGFDPLLVTPSSAGGFGLTSLHERARLIGGTLHITSMPRQGTTVALDVPLQQGV